MRFQSISLPFHCGWKRQWGLFLGSTDARNLASFHASLSPFPHLCFLLSFWSNPRRCTGVTQHRLDQSQLLSKASLKCTGGTVPLERWDMKAGRCILHAQRFPASSPPPSSFTSFAPPLPYHSSFVLLCFFSFSCHFLLYSLPSLSPHSHDSTEQSFPSLGGSWSPLGASAKIHILCLLLAFSLLINENSVHWKGHMFAVPQLVGTCVTGACAKLI